MVHGVAACQRPAVVSWAFPAEKRTSQTIAFWLTLLAFRAPTWWVTPRRVNAAQLFDGRRDNSRPPGVLPAAERANGSVPLAFALVIWSEKP